MPSIAKWLYKNQLEFMFPCVVTENATLLQILNDSCSLYHILFSASTVGVWQLLKTEITMILTETQNVMNLVNSSYMYIYFAVKKWSQKSQNTNGLYFIIGFNE